MEIAFPSAVLLCVFPVGFIPVPPLLPPFGLFEYGDQFLTCCIRDACGVLRGADHYSLSWLRLRDPQVGSSFCSDL